jgi:hypothetical protein
VPPDGFAAHPWQRARSSVESMSRCVRNVFNFHRPFRAARRRGKSTQQTSVAALTRTGWNVYKLQGQDLPSATHHPPGSTWRGAAGLGPATPKNGRQVRRGGPAGDESQRCIETRRGCERDPH